MLRATAAGRNEPLAHSPLHWVCHAAAVAHESIDVQAVLLVQVRLKLSQLLVPVTRSRQQTPPGHVSGHRGELRACACCVGVCVHVSGVFQCA